MIGSTADSIVATRPVAVPVPAGRYVRRWWHVIGADDHPVAAQVRARSVPADSLGTAVLLGSSFGWEDNARLLDGIASASREGGRLALIHLGAGGGSLLRVAAVEPPGLDFRCVELPAAPSARAIRIAVTLAGAEGPGPTEFQVDNTGRTTTTNWQPVDLPSDSDPADPLSDTGLAGAVLVTGGLGGLGLRAAAVLARTRRLHPVLVDTVGPDTLTPGAAGLLARLRAGRTGVTVLRADLTQAPNGLAGAVSSLPMTALVHCAGVLVAGPVRGTSVRELIAVQQVKTAGLAAALGCVDPGLLRALVAFGSITAVEPHRNLGGYALANELLARATLRAASSLPDCATVAAQWSLWSGAGMASRAGAIGQARRMGMTPVSLRAGLTTLVRLFGWPRGPAAATALRLDGRAI